MSLNSFVTPDGAEIGRAQAMQAAAAGIEPDARMNPVLLKPGASGSQVVLLGQPDGDVDALSYQSRKARLLEVALDSLAQLRREFDVVVCEGAGSPAEINLRATDIANMGLARAAGLPVIVVTDIDRGGVVRRPVRDGRPAGARRPGADRRVRDQQVPRRAVPARPRPGHDHRADRAAGPRRAALGARAVAGRGGLAGPGRRPARAARGRARPGGRRRAAGQRRAAAADQQRHRHRRAGRRAGRAGPAGRAPGRAGRRRPGRAARLPGHGGRPGLAARRRVSRRPSPSGPPGAARCWASAAATRCSRPGSRTTSSPGPGPWPGWGCCRRRCTFGAAKTLGRPAGSALGAPVAGYEIHHGIVTVTGGRAVPGRLPGRARCGGRAGTAPWRTTRSARRSSPRSRPWPGATSGPQPGVCFADLRAAQLDLLGDLVADHLDTAAVTRADRVRGAGRPAGAAARRERY